MADWVYPFGTARDGRWDISLGTADSSIATGITDGDLLRGVRYAKDKALTQSIVMRSKSGTVRFVDGEHQAHKWESYSRQS